MFYKLTRQIILLTVYSHLSDIDFELVKQAGISAIYKDMGILREIGAAEIIKQEFFVRSKNGRSLLEANISSTILERNKFR